MEKGAEQNGAGRKHKCLAENREVKACLVIENYYRGNLFFARVTWSGTSDMAAVAPPSFAHLNHKISIWD